MTPNEYIQAVRDEVVRLSMVHRSADQLGAPLIRVLDRHGEYPIYEECGHEHYETVPDLWHPVYDHPDVRLVEDLGLTCTRVYSVCRHCCTEDNAGEYQHEECARHSGPCFPCAEVRGIGAQLGIEWKSEVSR
ncbi:MULTISPECIES: hypothetical protein [unclassified Saccharopolyspora]|uniref:hypothetical protein n=1 Tax=unclassified Saccharopolyspora TaxID=2646250 RepID=UPI001CD31CB0|nr:MULTISPECIES: hypothetical protein [unclassified Saccharopolyspora]MCA1185773.1 hypothetical protein [Saccharopolyspora sp. 6T]MCA1191685.1 hypothetical protein [Saccharopolyspora sp. 6V]